MPSIYVNMADQKLSMIKQSVSPLFLRDEELRQGMDLLMAAARRLTVDVDALLRIEGLGRAHARALHTVVVRPDLPVSDLLAILGVTKQSLNRVLNDLLAGGYVEQRVGSDDRRQRLLSPTAKGRALDGMLWDAQRPRVVQAFRDAGPEAVAGFRRVLAGLQP